MSLVRYTSLILPLVTVPYLAVHGTLNQYGATKAVADRECTHIYIYIFSSFRLYVYRVVFRFVARVSHLLCLGSPKHVAGLVSSFSQRKPFLGFPDM